MLSLFEKPNALLRLEGFGVFVLALSVYEHQSFSWPLFWSTVLVPDLALLRYLVNARVGAVTYNVTHSKLLPCALALVSIGLDSVFLVSLSLIWFVHIGIDRFLGYGLKYTKGFKFTHLGLIGPAANFVFNRYLPCGK